MNAFQTYLTENVCNEDLLAHFEYAYRTFLITSISKCAKYNFAIPNACDEATYRTLSIWTCIKNSGLPKIELNAKNTLK